MLPTEIIERYRVRKGGDFRLADFDPDDTCGLDIDKGDAKELLETGVKRLAKLQDGSGPTIAGRSWSSCKASIPPARMASSSM